MVGFEVQTSFSKKVTGTLQLYGQMIIAVSLLARESTRYAIEAENREENGT